MSTDNNKIDVDYVAQLARLELDVAAKARLQKDLDAIVGYIAELQELDVTGIEPTAHAIKLDNVYREDIAGESLGRRMLDNAPALLDGDLIKVPKVLPGEGMN